MIALKQQLFLVKLYTALSFSLINSLNKAPLSILLCYVLAKLNHAPVRHDIQFENHGISVKGNKTFAMLTILI